MTNNINKLNRLFLQCIKRSLFIILTIFCLQLNAQEYPVQLTAQLNTPIPLNLSLFNVGANPKINLTLTNRDL